MKIPYRRPSEYQPVDVARLRPGGSYKQLIEKRTHPIDELVRGTAASRTTCCSARRVSDLRQPRTRATSSTRTT